MNVAKLHRYGIRQFAHKSASRLTPFRNTLFYCTKAKFAVELDGGGHGFPDQRAKDEKRNQFLAEKGIKVPRFWNQQLRGELEGVRFEIWHALMERTRRAEEIAGYMAKAAPSP